MVAGLPLEVIENILSRRPYTYQTHNLKIHYYQHYLIHNFDSSPLNYAGAIKVLTVPDVIAILDELIDTGIKKDQPCTIV